MLSFNQLMLTRGSKILLDHASLQLNPGYRAGLIGRNGTGKTSLMQVILGNISTQGGEVQISSGCRLGYLEQELPSANTNVIDYTCAGDDEWLQVQAELRIAEEKADGTAIAELYAHLEQIDGYRILQRASRILKGLGFSDVDMQRHLSEFSGGWQMRVQLARVLISRADLLLLDEPTNHLDLESIIWLESWLQDFKGTALIISHDRDFLDAVTTHSVHLTQHQFKLYQGNYSSFAKQREEALILQAKGNVKIMQKRAHMQSFVDRFRAKASKARQAQSRLKALEKLQTSSSLQAEAGFSFEFFESEKVSYPALSAMGKMGYPDKVVIPYAEISVGYGERIGIVGRNGCGKTTFLKTLSSQLNILEGQVNSNPRVKIGYFSQQQLETLHLDESPYQHMRSIAPKESEAQLRKYLGRFAFNDNRIFENIRHFSGGEKSRLVLALLIWQRPNVLILDEPTNHLDMTMREALIMALQQYEGTVLLVSHDRHLLKACVDELIMIQNGELQRFSGDCDDYAEVVISMLREPGASSSSNTAKATKPGAHKKVKKLEKKIAVLQAKLNNLDTQMADPQMHQKDHLPQLQGLQAERDVLAAELDQLEAEWLDLQG